MPWNLLVNFAENWVHVVFCRLGQTEVLACFLVIQMCFILGWAPFSCSVNGHSVKAEIIFFHGSCLTFLVLFFFFFFSLLVIRTSCQLGLWLPLPHPSHSFVLLLHLLSFFLIFLLPSVVIQWISKFTEAIRVTPFLPLFSLNSYKPYWISSGVVACGVWLRTGLFIMISQDLWLDLPVLSTAV